MPSYCTSYSWPSQSFQLGRPVRMCLSSHRVTRPQSHNAPWLLHHSVELVQMMKLYTTFHSHCSAQMPKTHSLFCDNFIKYATSMLHLPAHINVTQPGNKRNSNELHKHLNTPYRQRLIPKHTFQNTQDTNKNINYVLNDYAVSIFSNIGSDRCY